MKFSLSPIVFLLVVLSPAIAPYACAAVRTWLGGTGAWENNNNWSGTLQPFDPDTAIIGAGRPVISFVEGIAALQVGAGAGIDQGGALSVHGSVQNDGQISVLANGQFQIDAGTLSGGGEVVLTDSVGTYATINGAPNPNPCCVTHAATHVIRGEGAVAGRWINNGLIRAEEASGDSTATLHLIGEMTNHGVIRSSATGSVNLEGTLTIGATGQVVADHSSIVLVGTTSVTGGTLQAINGAKIIKDATGAATLSGVTLDADLDVIVTNGGVTGVGTGVTNNGTITVDNSGVGNGEFSMAMGTTLGGSGTLILNRANNDTKLTGNFTHGANHTIRGAGVIQATVINNGAMVAEPKTGGGLLRFINNTLTNNNLVQANNGGVFRFEQEAAINQGTAGRIRAASGGTVELMNNATVTGGKLQTDGTGVITTPVSNASVLVDVTNEGTFHTAVGAITRIRGASLTNNGATS